jgi:hypothetical protein
MSSTTVCPAANWSCFADKVPTVGGPLLGPAKASGLRVSDVKVWPAVAGLPLRGIVAQLSLPGHVGYMGLSELPGGANLSANQTSTHATRVQGTTALFIEQREGEGLKWNLRGRKMTLWVDKALPGVIPTEAQLVATANALVLYTA